VLGRDVLILAAAGVLYLATERRNFRPSPWGKISTFVQIVFLCFQIGYLSGIAVAPAVTALKWLTVALAVASLADYARRIATSEPH
jgi:phosphatidylglycerophosphate synthase